MSAHRVQKNIILTTLVSVVFGVVALVAPALKVPAAYADTEGAFTYTVTGGQSTLTAYDTVVGGTDVVIPSSLGGNPVTAIADEAFLNLGITSVTIPESVTSIGMSAFLGNLLESVTLPNSLASIGGAAFQDNPLLSSLSIGTSDYEGPAIFDIPMSAFNQLNLTSLTIGKSVRSIGSNAFAYNQITSVTIPDSVVSIEDNLFSNNPLQTVVIGSTDYSGAPHLDITANAFSGLSISSLTLGPVVLSIGDSAFQDNQLSTLTIPDSVQSIGASAFYNNQISSLDLGSVSHIGSSAFINNNLTSVFIPNSVQTMGCSIVNGNTSLSSVTIGTLDFSGTPTLTIDPCQFSPSSQITSLSIGNNVVAIEGGAFVGLDATSLVIPSSVKTIGGGAFSGSSLENVTIGNGVEYIGSGAFSGSQINTLSLGNSIATIDGGAFYANKLTSVRIPSSVENIEGGAFNENRITRIIVEGNTIIQPGAFEDNGFDRATIPSDLTQYSPEWYEYIRDNTSLISLYATDPSASYTDRIFTDGSVINGGYIVNPAALNIAYKDEDGNELRPTTTHTSPTFSNYMLANTLDKSDPDNHTLDLSPYYRLGETVPTTPIDIDGFATPTAQAATLSVANNTDGTAGNTVSYVYINPSTPDPTDPDAEAPGVPNTGFLSRPNSLLALISAGGVLLVIGLWALRRQS